MHFIEEKSGSRRSPGSLGPDTVGNPNYGDSSACRGVGGRESGGCVLWIHWRWGSRRCEGVPKGGERHLSGVAGELLCFPAGGLF